MSWMRLLTLLSVSSVSKVFDCTNKFTYESRRVEVSEEDKASVHALLLDLSALNFSQAARMKLHTTTRSGIWPSFP